MSIQVIKPTMTVANILSMYPRKELLKSVGNNIKPRANKQIQQKLSLESIASVVATVASTPGMNRNQISKETGLSGGCIGRVWQHLSDKEVLKRVRTNAVGSYGEYSYYLFGHADVAKCQNVITFEDVLNYIRKNELATRPEMSLNLNITEYRLKKALVSLLEDGKIIRHLKTYAGKHKVYAYTVA